MNSSASRWRKASSACAKSGTPRISWVFGPGTARILQLARLRVAIEEGPELRPDRHHQAEVVFEGARVLEAAGRDGVEAGVPDQLLRHLAGTVLGRVEVARTYTLLVDVFVLVGVVGVERLGDGTADDRLDLVRVRRELLVAVTEDVGRVDRDLALEPADLSERVGNRGRRNGDEDGVGVGCIAAVVAESRNRVPCLLPPVGEPAADV